jgi:hypothetical protein
MDARRACALRTLAIAAFSRRERTTNARGERGRCRCAHAARRRALLEHRAGRRGSLGAQSEKNVLTRFQFALYKRAD